MKSFSVMEWNSKSPPEWDWENLAMFGAMSIEIPKRLQPSNHEIEGDGGIENGSPYSPGVGDFTGSDLGHGSSSKSSISASADSSSKEGMETFRTAVCLSDTYSHKELTNENSTGNFATLGASVGFSEQIIGLKLGKRTYFEDICATSTTKTSSFSVIPTSSATTTKRSRASYQSTQAPHCQVEGCNLDLKSTKDYHRRHRICESHSKSPKVIVAGMEHRFCQQCSRLHDLSEFDEKKRSCRRRLSDHNARRRRPQSEATPFNSARMSSSLYDVRRHKNIVFNRTAIPDANLTWQSLCSLKYAQTGSSLVRPTKAVGADGQLHLPMYHMPDAISMLRIDSDRVLSFEGNTSRINIQGLGASSIASNSHVAPDLRRALSLLSTNCFGLSEPDTTSLDQFMHVNQTSMAQPVMHAELPNWAFASSQYVQGGQPHNAPQVHPLDLRNSGSSQIQEFSVAQSPL